MFALKPLRQNQIIQTFFDGLKVRFLTGYNRDPSSPEQAAILNGIAVEFDRLGDRPYLAATWFHWTDDIEAEDRLMLDGSFAHLGDALNYQDALLNALRTEYPHQTNTTRLANISWRECSAQHTFDRVLPVRTIRVLKEKRVAFSAEPNQRIEYCARILGPFAGEILGDELLIALSESSEILEQYFSSCGA